MIILLKENYQFARWLYNILIFKISIFVLIFLFLLQETHYHLNGERIFHNLFLILVFLKGLIDFIIMAFLSSLLINYNLIIFNQLKTSLSNFLIKNHKKK